MAIRKRFEETPANRPVVKVIAQQWINRSLFSQIGHTQDRISHKFPASSVRLFCFVLK